MIDTPYPNNAISTVFECEDLEDCPFCPNGKLSGSVGIISITSCGITTHETRGDIRCFCGARMVLPSLRYPDLEKAKTVLIKMWNSRGRSPFPGDYPFFSSVLKR